MSISFNHRVNFSHISLGPDSGAIQKSTDRAQGFSSGINQLIRDFLDPSALIGFGLGPLAYRAVGNYIGKKMAIGRLIDKFGPEVFKGLSKLKKAHLVENAMGNLNPMRKLLAYLTGGSAGTVVLTLSSNLTETARGHKADWSMKGLSQGLAANAALLQSMLFFGSFAAGEMMEYRNMGMGLSSLRLASKYERALVYGALGCGALFGSVSGLRGLEGFEWRPHHPYESDWVTGLALTAQLGLGLYASARLGRGIQNRATFFQLNL